MSGAFITSAGGRVSRIVLASHDGLFEIGLTPEIVGDRWADVMEPTRDHEALGLAWNEIPGQPREYEVIQRLHNEAKPRARTSLRNGAKAPSLAGRPSLD